MMNSKELRSPQGWEIFIREGMAKVTGEAIAMGKDPEPECRLFLIASIEKVQDEAWKRGIEDARLYVSRIGWHYRSRDVYEKVLKWVTLGLGAVRRKHNAGSFRHHYAYLDITQRN